MSRRLRSGTFPGAYPLSGTCSAGPPSRAGWWAGAAASSVVWPRVFGNPGHPESRQRGRRDRSSSCGHPRTDRVGARRGRDGGDPRTAGRPATGARRDRARHLAHPRGRRRRYGERDRIEVPRHGTGIAAPRSGAPPAPRSPAKRFECAPMVCTANTEPSSPRLRIIGGAWP